MTHYDKRTINKETKMIDLLRLKYLTWPLKKEEEVDNFKKQSLIVIKTELIN